MQHLDEDISIDDVARHCHFSKYYFSRVFKAATGESIYAFIKRMKIEQSAISLKTETNKSITDIGVDYGYSPSNYSSAFRKYHDISPAGFRNSLKTISILHPYYHLKTANFPTYKEYDQQTCIQKFAAYQVIYERHIGNYIELDQNWLDFTKKYHDYIDENTLLIERSYDDPCITNLGHCMYDICITVDKNCPLENVTTIPESKYAVYRYDGPVTEIFSAFQGLFHIWLAQSEYEMGERYGLGIYRSIDRLKQQVVMDLCIPIK